MIRKSDKARERDLLKAELDALARERTFKRDDYKCVVEGCNRTNIQWCHVETRGILSLRWDLDNSLTMCGGHHLAWHKSGREWGQWFAKKYPERNKHLMEVKSMKITVDLKALLVGLRIGATNVEG